MRSVLESSARAGDAEALIAEARAHARRRRRRIAGAVIIAAALAGATLFVTQPTGGSRPSAAATRSPAAHAAGPTGIVAGHLEACNALGAAAPVTPGTVTVVRGTVTEKPAGSGQRQNVFPAGPVVARQRISNNYDQTFRFALSPGQYVIEGRYDPPPERDGRPIYPGKVTDVPGTWIGVTVTAGRTIREDLPDFCA